MAKSQLTLQEQANEILVKAEERGVQSNFFFVTTFKRYQVQMTILSDLEKAIKEYGATVIRIIRCVQLKRIACLTFKFGTIMHFSAVNAYVGVIIPALTILVIYRIRINRR